MSGIDWHGNEWKVEELLETGSAFLLTPHGTRVAKMTKARAYGIAAALNTVEGREAFERARVQPTYQQPRLEGGRQYLDVINRDPL